MTTIILQTAARFLLKLMLLYSIFLLIRGHNHPGGGFIGGLVGAAAWTLYTIAYGIRSARKRLPVDFRALIGVGLLVAIGSGLGAALSGKPFLAANWLSFKIQEDYQLYLGTPLLFDFGVYLTILGSAVTILVRLEEEDE